MDIDEQMWAAIENGPGVLDTTLDESDTASGEKRPTDYQETVNYTPEGDSTIIITKSGAFIKFEYLSSNIITAIKTATKIDNYFTLRYKTVTGHIQQLKCAKIDKANKRIVVPRFGVYEILQDKYKLDNFTTKSQIVKGDKPNNKFTWQGVQTENQKLIATEILNTYFTPERVSLGSAGVIVNLEAGQGKSYLAAYLISVIQRKTAILLHSTALIEQWAKVLKNAFGPDVSIGYYYGKKKVDGDIVILIVDSASSSEFKLNNEIVPAITFYNRFGFIIIDECHTFANKMALKALRSAQAPYMLSLSATPDENIQGYDAAVWWSVGPVLNANDVPGYVSTADDFTADVHRVMYYGPKEYTKVIINPNTELVSMSSMINMLCTDKYRSQLVIDCIKEGLKLNLFIFVFADRREYLAELRTLLEEQTNEKSEILESNDDFVRIVGGAKPGDLEQAEVKSKVIFTTYQYMGTGKSVVKMTGLVLATPRKSKMKQYINRIFRLGSDMNIKRHIWDICDMKIKLNAQWRKRREHYVTKKYNIITTKVDYDDIDLGQIEESPIITPHTEIVKRKPVTIDTKKISAIADSLINKIRNS
jgi:hypothetical protein